MLQLNADKEASSAKIILFANDTVGKSVTSWMCKTYSSDLLLIVTTSKNEIYYIAKKYNIPCIIYITEGKIINFIRDNDFRPDFCFLVWWPNIIHHDLLLIPRIGFINTHPSYLPYSRGKHFSFWTIVEQSPFGVSLHFVNEGIDSGDIIAQKEIFYTWEDTSETLYNKSKIEMHNLFIQTYPTLRNFSFTRTKQDFSRGSFHYGREIEEKSKICLEQQYSARQLLNLLRARTFTGHPSCSFTDAGTEYEVRITIEKRTKQTRKGNI